MDKDRAASPSPASMATLVARERRTMVRPYQLRAAHHRARDASAACYFPRMSAADLAVDTAVLPAGDGRYTATISDRWNFLSPSGGMLMTTALRAIRDELADPALRPIS